MLKYAVMTFMYGKWVNSDEGSHEELIRILSEAGADGVEAFANHFFGNDDVIKLYQREMANRGLTMPVMDLIANLVTSDTAARDEAYEAMRKGIDVCDALGTEIVHLAGGRLAEGQDPENGRELVVEGIMDFVDDIEQRGMVLAFENFPGAPTVMVTADDCLEIIRETGNRAKFVFDTGNFEFVREHAEDNFAKLIEHTVHFHFKDFRPEEEDPTVCRGAHFGQGRIKNREVARAINECGYSGWVALESYLQGDNGPQETVAAELAVLKSMLE